MPAKRKRHSSWCDSGELDEDGNRYVCNCPMNKPDPKLSPEWAEITSVIQVPYIQEMFHNTEEGILNLIEHREKIRQLAIKDGIDLTVRPPKRK